MSIYTYIYMSMYTLTYIYIPIMSIFTYMYVYHHHHHHVVPQARISLILSRHFSLSFIASGRSSGPHSVSSHSCWMYVRAGRPAFARPYVRVHRSTLLMSSSLLLAIERCMYIYNIYSTYTIGQQPHSLLSPTKENIQ